jgi:hypothetical protein
MAPAEGVAGALTRFFRAIHTVVDRKPLEMEKRLRNVAQHVRGRSQSGLRDLGGEADLDRTHRSIVSHRLFVSRNPEVESAQRTSPLIDACRQR